MWFIALFGAASAFAESALAQAYKNKENGKYIGGPQMFIEKGLKLKPLAVLIMNITKLPGILWMIVNSAFGVNQVFGGLLGSAISWGGKLLAIMVVLFVFTSLMGYYYQAESTMRYLFKGKPIGTWIMRITFLVAVFAGVVVEGTVVWDMADLGVGLMAWFNIISILLLSNKAVALLKDYEEQRKDGKRPLFDPAKFGIDDPTGAWAERAAMLREREK